MEFSFLVQTAVSWYWVLSSSVRVTSAKFQQGVGRTSTGTNRPYISVICFYSYSRKFLFLLSKNMNNWFLFPLSKLETGISNFSFYSRNPRSEFHISLSTLEIRDQNLVFLFLLSKFETRISNFSFYSRNLRSEFQISLSTLEFTFFDSRQCLIQVSVLFQSKGRLHK